MYKKSKERCRSKRNGGNIIVGINAWTVDVDVERFSAGIVQLNDKKA